MFLDILQQALVVLHFMRVCYFKCRIRFWESAERLSRRGEVDGVAIITLVRLHSAPSATKHLWHQMPTMALCLMSSQSRQANPSHSWMQVRSKSEPLKVILEAQFRPSQGSLVIEVSAAQ